MNFYFKKGEKKKHKKIIRRSLNLNGEQQQVHPQQLPSLNEPEVIMQSGSTMSSEPEAARARSCSARMLSTYIPRNDVIVVVWKQRTGEGDDTDHRSTEIINTALPDLSARARTQTHGNRRRHTDIQTHRHHCTRKPTSDGSSILMPLYPRRSPRPPATRTKPISPAAARPNGGNRKEKGKQFD